MKDGTRMDHWVVFGMLAHASDYARRADFQEGAKTVGPRTQRWLSQGIQAMASDELPQTPKPTRVVSEIDRITRDPHWPFPPSPMPK